MENCFSSILSGLRRRRGFSQRAVAADLRISQALLSHYENGAREPGLDFLSRACDYYGVSADYLLGRTDSEQPTQSRSGQSLISADAALAAALRPLESRELELIIERYLTASVLKMLEHVTLQTEGSREEMLNAEMAVSELQAAMMIEKLKSEQGIDLRPMGLEARSALEIMAARIKDYIPGF